MSLSRQGLLFVMVGGFQLAVDSLLFVALTWAGAPVSPANLAARAGAAGLGFWLNGRFTFTDGTQPRLGSRRFSRFIVVWVGLTIVSTIVLSMLADAVGLEGAWLAKPVVEIGLALLSFFLQRHWVYR
jgi:putative flippase GtrA